MAIDEGRIDGESHRPRSGRRWAWEWTKSFIIAFGLFLIIRTFLVEAFRIPTGSMESTLLVGDFLLVNKAVYGARVPFARTRTPAVVEPARGDIVVFIPPHDPGKNYVKRVIGVPGDTLEMRDAVLLLNGQDRAETYVRLSDAPDMYASGMFWQCEHAAAGGNGCRPTRDNWGPIVVPDGRYFVMGDNRNDSEDSRYWGFVPRDAIRGRPLFIYYSFDPASGRSTPWLSSIRWSRVGNGLH
ncbi:MAG: signal peptidase I [Gemmatimonadetes bacterium]|nr:signal peptidase I [Gemmatimonadota bacterium]